MKRRFAIVVLMLVVGGFLGLWFRSIETPRDLEIKLQGRTIREWLNEVEIGEGALSDTDADVRLAATQALASLRQSASRSGLDR